MLQLINASVQSDDLKSELTETQSEILMYKYQLNGKHLTLTGV